MSYNINDVIVFDDTDKVIVLDKIYYEGSIYLLVDKLNSDETEMLNMYHVLRVNENGNLQKEVDIDFLIKVITSFKSKNGID